MAQSTNDVFDRFINLLAEAVAEKLGGTVSDSFAEPKKTKAYDVHKLSKAADDGDDDAAKKIVELAGQMDVDPDEYDTWADVVKAMAQAPSADDEVPEDDDEAGDDEEFRTDYTEDELNEMDRDTLKELCGEWEIDFGQKPRIPTMVANILEAQENYDPDAEDDDVIEDDTDSEDDEGTDDEAAEDLDALGTAADDEEDEEAQERLTELADEANIDPNDFETWSDLATALSEGAVEDEGDDGEGADFWTKEELDPKPIGELKAIAKDYKLKTEGMNKAKIISAILAS